MEKVIHAVPHKNYYLEIEFDTGEKKMFDARPYLNKGVFQRLQDVKATETIAKGRDARLADYKILKAEFEGVSDDND